MRLRDGGKCVVCGGTFNIWRLQAHHIKPKALYPFLEHRLDNGVTVCTGCHMGSVHRGNTFVDCSDDESHRGWRMFQPMFERWNDLAGQRSFNIRYQD